MLIDFASNALSFWISMPLSIVYCLSYSENERLLKISATEGKIDLLAQEIKQ
jgi:hypothetical protein